MLFKIVIILFYRILRAFLVEEQKIVVKVLRSQKSSAKNKLKPTK